MPAFLSLILAEHHPIASSGAAGVVTVASVDCLVHGGLITAAMLQAFGFFLFTAKLGGRRPGATAGFLAYALGIVLITIAALIDGFVMPDLAGACLAAPGECESGNEFLLAAATIQVFTKAALIVMSAAVAIWAVILLRNAARTNRVAGALGLLCAGMPVVLFLVANARITPGNVAGMIAAQLAWSMVAAWWMVATPRDPDADGRGNNLLQA